MDLPLVAYDIPGSVVAKLPTDVVVTLAGDGTLAGLKDSSGDLDGLRAVLESASVPGFRCFSGSETLADLGLFIGAHGLVPGIGNVDPHGYLRLFAAAGQADWDTARTEQSRLRRLFRLVNVGGQRMGGYSSAIGAFKEGLVARGVIAHATTSEPMIPLNDTERAVVRRHLDEAGLL